MSSDSTPGFRPILRLPATTDSLQREIDDEIHFHIESRCDDLIRAGYSPQQARETAEREYGDTAQSKRELVELDRRRLGQERRQEIFMSIAEDLRYAARGLARRPALAAVVTFALTIGIAANAVMFSVVDQLLLQPPPLVAGADGLRRVYFRWEQDGKINSQPVNSFPALAALRDGVPAFAELAIFDRTSVTLGRGTEARSADVELVTGNYFRTLGVKAAIGRAFDTPEDALPDGAAVTVISHGLWQRELGGARDVVGRTVELDGKRYTVIGVMPEGFSGINQLKVDAWVPLSSMAGTYMVSDWYRNTRSYWAQSVARMKPGSTEQQAASQATAVYRATLRAEAREDTSGSVVFGPINGTRSPNGVSAEGRVSLWLLGVSAMVFLIACANAANLLIASMLQRRREIAVRLALGVSRGRLMQQFLVEAALIAAISGATALIVAHWAGRVVQSVLLPGLVWRANVIDLRVLGFTLAAVAGCVVLAGLVPAIQGLRTSVSDGLKASSRQAGAERGALRSVLLGVQAMLSVVLLIGAGLFVKSLDHVSKRDVGIDLDRVMLVRMDLSKMGFNSAQTQEVYRSAAERIRRVPGVTMTSLVGGSVPMTSGNAMGFRVRGVQTAPRIPGGGPYGSVVGADFFTTTGTKLIRGRLFSPDEERVASRVVVISELVAKSYWPKEDPIGKCVTVRGDSTCTQIIGVVQNVLLFSLVNDDRATIYLPPTHPSYATRPPAALLIRVAGEPSDVVPLIQQQIQSISPNMPFVRVRPFYELVARQMQPWRLGAAMFTLFGIVALVIAGVGLYSVLAYWVSQRTHEIGVRMALGAQRRDVMRLVALRGSAPVLIGLIAGLAIAAFASRWIAAMLYETSPRDVRVYLTATLVLALAAVAASVVPALRSTAVDPATALRAE